MLSLLFAVFFNSLFALSTYPPNLDFSPAWSVNLIYGKSFASDVQAVPLTQGSDANDSAHAKSQRASRACSQGSHVGDWETSPLKAGILSTANKKSTSVPCFV